MLDNAKELSLEDLKKLKKDVAKDKSAKILQNAASKTNITTIVYNPSGMTGLSDVFNVEVKSLSVCNQKASGRCWIFAALNMLREDLAKKLNVSNIELSQNFVAFYDKLEKINYTLECAIEFIDLPHDDRTVERVLSYPVGDGGQWDMFANLVKKYGLCPKQAMDESYTSSNTREHNFIINTSIRKFAATAKHLHEENRDDEIRPLKDKVLKELYRSLEIVFGTPTEKFDFEYKDNEGKYHIDKNLTPKKFYEKYIGKDIDEYISIINSPTKDKPYYASFTVDYVGNVIGGKPIRHLNLPMDEIKDLVIKQLKNNEVVWFGSDCSKYGDRTIGLWAPEQYDYELAFNLDLAMTKEDMLDYYQSAMNHAMVITAVNIEKDKPTKWRIENSWGSDAGKNGYYTASDRWFDDYVYQVVVHKKYLTKEMLDAYNKDVIHLHPWDPMGTLAK